MIGEKEINGNSKVGINMKKNINNSDSGYYHNINSKI